MENEIIHIIDRYLAGTANAEEIAMVEALLETMMTNESLTDNLTETERSEISQKMWKEISETISPAAKEKLKHLH